MPRLESSGDTLGGVDEPLRIGQFWLFLMRRVPLLARDVPPPFQSVIMRRILDRFQTRFAESYFVGSDSRPTLNRF